MSSQNDNFSICRYLRTLDCQPLLHELGPRLVCQLLLPIVASCQDCQSYLASIEISMVSCFLLRLPSMENGFSFWDLSRIPDIKWQTVFDLTCIHTGFKLVCQFLLPMETVIFGFSHNWLNRKHNCVDSLGRIFYTMLTLPNTLINYSRDITLTLCIN